MNDEEKPGEEPTKERSPALRTGTYAQVGPAPRRGPARLPSQDTAPRKGLEAGAHHALGSTGASPSADASSTDGKSSQSANDLSLSVEARTTGESEWESGTYRLEDVAAAGGQDLGSADASGGRARPETSRPAEGRSVGPRVGGAAAAHEDAWSSSTSQRVELGGAAQNLTPREIPAGRMTRGVGGRVTQSIAARLKTGYFKPLPPTQQARRHVDALGLFLGQNAAWFVRDDSVYLLLMAVIVGTSAGLAAGVLLAWIERANGLFASVSGLGLIGVPVLIAIPALGGLLVGILQVVLTRLNVEIPTGPGTVIVSVAHRGGHLDGFGGAALGVGTGLSIGSGGSCGHEGPSVVIGATVGSVVARFFGLRARRQVAMVGAGAAAGLAAAFNAPLAGVIFTVEVIFRRSVGGNVGTMSVFTPLVVAAVAGTLASHAVFGGRTEFAVLSAGSESLREVPFYLLLAAVAGLVAVALDQAILRVKSGFELLPVPEWTKPAIGGALVGLAGALLFTEIMGAGRPIIAQALRGQLIWTFALALIALKIIVTALTVGSRGMGGVFMPALFVGACLGTVIQTVAVAALGEHAAPVSAYALLGMGAILGASLRAPITPIVMIFELTHDYGLIVPMMFVTILSSFIAGRIQPEGLYDLLLRAPGMSVDRAANEEEVMKQGRVGELMIKPDHMLRADSSFEEVQRAALVEDVPVHYFLDNDGRVAGYIDSVRLAAMALRDHIDTNALAKDLSAGRAPALLKVDDTLAGAMLAMAQSHKDVLPVVDDDGRCIGILHRHDLIVHYSDRVLNRKDAELELRGAGTRNEIALPAGVIVERVVVTRRWAGKTLHDLDLRRRCGAFALEWRRGATLLEIDPGALLREGDILALVGRREAILKARTLE